MTTAVRSHDRIVLALVGLAAVALLALSTGRLDAGFLDTVTRLAGGLADALGAGPGLQRTVELGVRFVGGVAEAVFF